MKKYYVLNSNRFYASKWNFDDFLLFKHLLCLIQAQYTHKFPILAPEKDSEMEMAGWQEHITDEGIRNKIAEWWIHFVTTCCFLSRSNFQNLNIRWLFFIIFFISYNMIFVMIYGWVITISFSYIVLCIFLLVNVSTGFKKFG